MRAEQGSAFEFRTDIDGICELRSHASCHITSNTNCSRSSDVSSARECLSASHIQSCANTSVYEQFNRSLGIDIITTYSRLMDFLMALGLSTGLDVTDATGFFFVSASSAERRLLA